jgi:mRNA interferase MazF
VPFPFTDLTSVKTRPALVLSSAAFNRSGRDVVVCAMTSNVQDSGHSVLLADGDLSAGRLPKPTRVKCGKVATLAQELVRRRWGRLTPRAMRQVWNEVGTVLEP